MTKRIFGEILGEPEGTCYASREALSRAGVHRPVRAGISGSADEGADSVVLSGGYEDDEDYGDVIVYTGYGGRDTLSCKQTSDQTLTKGNLALARNRLQGLPVRVVRGSGQRSKYAPEVGYRYDGLFRVCNHWKEQGNAGYLIWRFRLEKIPGEPDREHNRQDETPPQSFQTVSGIVRDSRQSRAIRRFYNCRCQVCGIRLEGNGSSYAEAAHIRPFNIPHLGPDVLESLLCLCPSHPVLFNLGGLSVADDLSLLGAKGALQVHPQRGLNPAHLRYHRDHYNFDADAPEQAQ